MILPITNGFYRLNLPVSMQEAINCYPVPCEAPSLVPEYMQGTPGLAEVATTGTLLQQNRGCHVMNGVPYFVNGIYLYRLLSDLTIENLGVIGGSARVSMADNGTQLCVLIPGGAGFIYNHVADTLTEITDVDFRANGNPLYVTFIQSYFCFTTDEKKFIISAENDGLAYNPLDFGAAESDPDPVVAPINLNNQLFIMGGSTGEAYQNQGGADFPFQSSGLIIQKGCYSPLSLILTQSSFMFIGGGNNEGPAVWALAGNGVQKISTDAIDTLLGALTADELANVYAWTEARSGYYFVGFALPTTTIVYDWASKRWHERRSYNNSVNGPYRVSGVMTAYGAVYCADIYDGRIGALRDDVYAEYGNNIISVIVTQPFQDEMKSIFVPQLELTVESGVGNADSPDPVVTMDRSLDGKTWTAPRTRAMGAIGNYRRRCIWRRNGRASRYEAFRFTVSDKVKRVFMQLTAPNLSTGVK